MRKSDGTVTYWEQEKGKRATIQILRYQCVKGNSDFIATGKKPVCPECKGKKLRGVMELEQLGLFSSKFALVMQCKNAECGAMVCYEYELAYEQSNEV